MCGIAGTFDRSGHKRVDRAVLEQMAESLRHRGPDDSGFHLDGDVGLAFRRLAIIDLNSGNQPIFNEDRSLVLICNGEIFNYRELRGNLEALGHTFYTQCDVEVLVHLYEEYGCDFIRRLNGQFSFAIYDRRKQQLLLARDQVGIAPLFFTCADECFIFASEIKSILRHPLVPRRVDLTGLDQILSFPGLVSPRTMFEGISSLQPGHYALISRENIAVREYWDLIYPHEADIQDVHPESYYIDQLEMRLQASVDYRLMADVPVGFYLSGGMDSSIIAAMICKRPAKDRRHSFSIAFRDAQIDERNFQRLMAARLPVEHHEIEFDWPDIQRRFRDIIYHAEAPLKESYNACSLALSQAVREHGIKVVLTGEGADELFAGYIGYRLDAFRAPSLDESFGLEATMESEIRERLWGDSTFFYERNQFDFRETKQALFATPLNDIFDTFDCTRAAFVDRTKLQGRHPIHKRSYLDFKLRLADHLISDHGDRVAYANSIEARYPFLDPDLIDFVRTIPPRFLVKGKVEKYILKKLATAHLPEEIARREKFAFVAPGSPYLLRQSPEWVNDWLSPDRIRRQGYFNPETIERLKKIYSEPDFQINQTFESDLLMIVLSFSIFLDVFDMPEFR